MTVHGLINKRVMNKKNRLTGIIASVGVDSLSVNHGPFGTVRYPYPAAFTDTLILEDTTLQEQLYSESIAASFLQFRRKYRHSIEHEIEYLRITGGKRYRLMDGVRIQHKNGIYLYSFETDSEMHFPDGTPIKLRFSYSDKREQISYRTLADEQSTHGQNIAGWIVACEDFTVMINTYEDLGEKVDSIQFTAESWHLIESLMDRLDEIDEEGAPIAYEIACKGRSQIDVQKRIQKSQSTAIKRASEESITFVWGPPGTGKTTTLAKIALEAMHRGERVLMVSYSNVSVDGATLKIADMSDRPEGQIVRYGYPRLPELVNSNVLTSYAYVIKKDPILENEFRTLIDQKKKMKKNNPKRVELNRRIDAIRGHFRDEEQELIHKCPFVATTVSKAVVDKAIYDQKFDVVIFDEASMAYVPQVVFAASLAKKRFCCLGDFRQLPAIVQSSDETLLKKDIFDYVEITSAVESGYGHNWLVMLDTQYRMHPTISHFVSVHMYEGLLRSADGIEQIKQTVADAAPRQKLPMSMVDLSGSYSVCIKTHDGSRINLMSAMICVRLAEMLVDKHETGIITPYSAQSRLILAMIRDLQERDSKFKSLTTATVHQFQGSEKPVIIYDAVDCYRMTHPGYLLTSKDNDTANRLFNVALTRTQGKFILVANMDFMTEKGLSPSLLFRRMMDQLKEDASFVRGEKIYEEIASDEGATDELFMGDRDEEDSWNRYLEDIRTAKRSVYMEIPGVIDDDEVAIEQLRTEIETASVNNVRIMIKAAENITLPDFLEEFAVKASYVTTPLSIIDETIIWFGEPLSAADFLTGGNPILTEHFPCLRFTGKHTGRLLKAIYEIPTLSREGINLGTNRE